mmetsp:Transcript_11679/g.40901  ORF Transcript_11679/g.40901 Transcript_11679/m.40901 type:complete len:643 (-) Transcript_11679:597-2525(-)
MVGSLACSRQMLHSKGLLSVSPPPPSPSLSRDPSAPLASPPPPPSASAGARCTTVGASIAPSMPPPPPPPPALAVDPNDGRRPPEPLDPARSRPMDARRPVDAFAVAGRSPTDGRRFCMSESRHSRAAATASSSSSPLMAPLPPRPREEPSRPLALPLRPRLRGRVPSAPLLPKLSASNMAAASFAASNGSFIMSSIDERRRRSRLPEPDREPRRSLPPPPASASALSLAAWMDARRRSAADIFPRSLMEARRSAAVRSTAARSSIDLRRAADADPGRPIDSRRSLRASRRSLRDEPPTEPRRLVPLPALLGETAPSDARRPRAGGEKPLAAASNDVDCDVRVDPLPCVCSAAAMCAAAIGSIMRSDTAEPRAARRAIATDSSPGSSERLRRRWSTAADVVDSGTCSKRGTFLLLPPASPAAADPRRRFFFSTSVRCRCVMSMSHTKGGASSAVASTSPAAPTHGYAAPVASSATPDACADSVGSRSVPFLPPQMRATASACVCGMTSASSCRSRSPFRVKKNTVVSSSARRPVSGASCSPARTSEYPAPTTSPSEKPRHRRRLPSSDSTSSKPPSATPLARSSMSGRRSTPSAWSASEYSPSPGSLKGAKGAVAQPTASLLLMTRPLESTALRTMRSTTTS